ncbi:MAG: S8 family serine peptidase, partial [Ruminococcus sp.]|nr:S8 family serine peptidase [Ruminococcus sp.]
EMISKYDEGKDFVSYDEFAVGQPSSYDANYIENEYEEKYEFQTSRLFVKSYDDINLLNSVDYKLLDDNTYIIQFASTYDAKQAFDYYNSLACIEYVEPDSVCSASGLIYKGDSSNEYYYNPDNSNFDTYDVNNAMNKLDDIIALKQYVLDNAVNLYEEVRVAVIDSGIKKEHEAISGRFIGGKDFATGQYNQGGVDTFGHGTAVASMIVDTSLPNTKIVSYRVGVNGDYSESSIVLAIKQALIDDIDIINCSFSNYNNSTTLCNAINEAHDNGVNIIAAAGNESTNIDNKPCYPAFYKNVTAVGSGDGSVAMYSNYGSDVQLYTFANPHVAYITGTDALDEYRTEQGTSVSAPAVAGACSMLKTLYRDETNNELIMRLWNGATKPIRNFSNTSQLKNGYQAGYLNSALLDTPSVEVTETPTISVKELEGGKKEITISHTDENATIWFEKENGKVAEGELKLELYKGPFTITGTIASTTYLYVCAKSDKMIKSDIVCKRINVGLNNNGFYCDKNGTILKFIPEEYSGDLDNIIVPDEIQGVIPVSLGRLKLPQSVFGEKNDEVQFKSITLPESITAIANNTFNNNRRLETIIAPGVTDIRSFVFYNCESLKNIQFAENFTLGLQTFTNCKSLTDFTPFEHLEEIPWDCFANCGFENIKSTNCKIINQIAFEGCVCI